MAVAVGTDDDFALLDNALLNELGNVVAEDLLAANHGANYTGVNSAGEAQLACRLV